MVPSDSAVGQGTVRRMTQFPRALTADERAADEREARPLEEAARPVVDRSNASRSVVGSHTVAAHRPIAYQYGIGNEPYRLTLHETKSAAGFRTRLLRDTQLARA